MTDQNIVDGRKFKLYRGAAGDDSAYPGDFLFVCPTVTISLERTTQFEDVAVPNCDNPEAILNEKSSPRSRSVRLGVSGSLDLVKLREFRVAEQNSAAIPLVLLYDVPAMQGGGYYKGLFYIEKLTHSMENRGVVKFAIDLRGQGDVPWTDLT